MHLSDFPPSSRPNLHHEHDGGYRGTHTHDITDHLGRLVEAVTHSHDPDGNVTVPGVGRYKLPKPVAAD